MYLCYCEAGFAERRIGVAQAVLAKPRWAPRAASAAARVVAARGLGAVDLCAASSTSAGAGTQRSWSSVGGVAASDGAQRVSNACGLISEHALPLRWCSPSTCPSSCAATHTDSGRGSPPSSSASSTRTCPWAGRPIEVV